MIKFIHRHEEEDKDCYLADRGYSEIGMYKIWNSNATFIVAYMQYTAHWYAFDPKTGREIATFTKEFFEDVIKRHKIDDFVRDESCNLY